MPTQVRSHAKINLGLAIGPPRPDGFHSLVTVYQTLEAHDLLTVTARPAPSTNLRLTSNDSRVPTDSRNTVWKMISLALDELRITADVSIHIEKRLPVQGGLGAGSANAVAALVGLEHELCIPAQPQTEQRTEGAPSGTLWVGRILPEGWETANPNRPRIPQPQTLGAPGLDSETWETTNPDWPNRRLAIAAQVGSDVPLFLIGGTILGHDRGQQVHPLPDLEPLWCVLAIPKIGVSTPQAFRDWDALCAAEGLTPQAGTDKLNRLSQAYLSAFGVEIPQAAAGQSSSGVLPELQIDGEDLAGPATSALVRTGITSWIQNDFERVVFPQHPSLAEIKRILAAPGTPEAAVYAALSGSGSALFGLYKTHGDAEAAQNRLGQQIQGQETRGLETRITLTLPRADYWREMLLHKRD